jgi:Protein of unknown function (DUF3224)
MSSPSTQALTLAVGLPLVSVLMAQAPKSAAPAQAKEVSMTYVAKGSFEVTMAPLTEGARMEAWAPGRMSIDKRFRGDLEWTSQGEMLTASTGTQGSAGYTAIEKVSGRLRGRTGTFLLQHFGVMARAIPGEWIVMVIPDSGTDELKGLTGKMTITITGKQHAYTLEYHLPEAP